MIQRLRQLTKQRFTVDVLWNVASLVILAGGGVLMNSLIVAISGPAALGVFNQVFAFYIVLSQLGVGGLQHSTLKHISYIQDDLKQCADITATALLLVIVFTIPVALVGIAAAPALGDLLDSEAVGRSIPYAMPGLLFFAANKVLINVLNGLARMRMYALFRALRFIFLPAFLIAILLIESDPVYLALSLTLAELLLFLVLMAYIYRKVLPVKRIADTRRHMQAHLSYGLRGVFSGILMELNTRVDVLMLGLFVSDTLVGYYSFAAIIAEGFGQLPVAVRYNVDPVIGQHFARNDRPAIEALSRQIRRYFVPAMLAMGLIGILGYPLLYTLLAGEAGLGDSWLVFGILVSAIAFTAAYSPFKGILLQGDAPGMFTLLIVAATINNVIFNAVLIPVFGLAGAATATALTIMIETALLVFLSRRLFNIRL